MIREGEAMARREIPGIPEVSDVFIGNSNPEPADR
jgi:hypothetical protein